MTKDVNKMWKEIKTHGELINKVDRSDGAWITYDSYYRYKGKYYQFTILYDRPMVMSIINKSVFEPSFGGF